MGYVNTVKSQFIPPGAMHFKTGTWTDAAGAVAGTIAKHKAATAETAVVTVPIMSPSNSNAAYNKGCYLQSIEIDYEILIADLTSLTAVLHKVVRGADTAVAVVSSPAFTQAPTAANSKVTDQHRLILTITTPEWIDDDAYWLAELTMVAPATTTIDVLGAVAQFTEKL